MASPALAQQPAPPALTYHLDQIGADDLALLAEGLAARQREMMALIGRIRQQVTAQDVANSLKKPAETPEPPK